MSREKVSVLDRLNAKTIKVKSIHVETECWEFTGAKTKDGYGRIYTTTVHRISAQIHFGINLEAIEKIGLEVCHKCHNRACWNPEHLYIGTRMNNADDKVISRKNVNSAISTILKEINQSKFKGD